MPQTDKTATALTLGQTAFSNGKPCIPALDPDLRTLLTDVKVGDGLPILKAWTKGWHTANLNSQTTPNNL